MLDDDDSAEAIEELATGSYQVTRRAAGGYRKGVAVDGPTTPLTITASVQPATGRDLLRLPEGRRAVATVVIFTPTELLVGGQGAANEADLVSINGQTWEVQHAEAWGSYWRCMAQASK